MDEDATTDFSKRMTAAIAYWQSNRSRMTFIRRIICEIIFKTDQPFEADWLLKEARQTDKLISMTSVYRTLKSLREANLVEEFQNQTTKGQYQLCPIGQLASSCIVCKNCGKTIPSEDPCLSLREGALAQQKGFKATQVRLQVEATCDEYESTGACSRECAKK
jgi:Fur family ferric uptake transcriptional regulator